MSESYLWRAFRRSSEFITTVSCSNPVSEALQIRGEHERPKVKQYVAGDRFHIDTIQLSMKLYTTKVETII